MENVQDSNAKVFNAPNEILTFDMNLKMEKILGDLVLETFYSKTVSPNRCRLLFGVLFTRLLLTEQGRLAACGVPCWAGQQYPTALYGSSLSKSAKQKWLYVDAKLSFKRRQSMDAMFYM